MIEYINNKLNQWGLWALTGRERTGYPNQAAFMRLVPTGGGDRLEICDEEAMQINRAVQTLEPQLRAVVDAIYIKMRSCDGETIARALGCGRTTLYARLDRAHLQVMYEIQEDELNNEPAAALKKKKRTA